MHTDHSDACTLKVKYVFTKIPRSIQTNLFGDPEHMCTNSVFIYKGELYPMIKSVPTL